MAQRAREVYRFSELPYHVVLVRDEAGGGQEAWTARVEGLPRCLARDQTADGRLERYRRRWRTGSRPPSRRATGRSRGPSPGTAAACYYGYPKDLHAERAYKADREDASLYGLITGTLAGAVGWQREDSTEEEALRLLSQASPGQAAARSRVIVVVVLPALAAIALLIIALQNGW